MKDLNGRCLGVWSVVLACVWALGPGGAKAQEPGGYYKVQPIYIPFPQPGKVWTVRNYGPVGLAIDLIDPAFTMRISGVEKGSPAEAAGKLKKGQIIESINGQVLKDIDPRVQLAQILTQAEATDGLLKLAIKGEGVVVVKVPVMGAYSQTWPLDCEKSDRVVRNIAQVLSSQDKPRWGSVMFLLSTGEEKDLAVVRGWMKDFKGMGEYPWFIGLEGRAVCEYYLRTGDASVLPAIKQMCDDLKEQIYSGAWSGRGKASFTYMAGGHMNAAGVHCLTFLLLAKQCGVDVDEHTLQSSLKYFYRFAGHANVAYGDQYPEGGYRDNGKTGGLALAMSAAAGLVPDGEKSTYAAARDNSAMKSFYASSWFNRAHTGGGIGEIWHASAMQYLYEKKPVQYRSFMEERQWHLELSRRADGSFGIHDGERYDVSATQNEQSWGTHHALVYTAARKKLRLFGAPPTQWCKTYALPERPWGNVADDAFLSNEPAEVVPGKPLDISQEKVPTDASAPLLGRLGQPDVSEETLLMYAGHPDYGVREQIANIIVRSNRDHLILGLLKHTDPRVREVGVLTIAGMFKGKALPNERITPEMYQLVGSMIENKDESWWVSIKAMEALARANPEQIAQHADRLIEFLNHDDWWLHLAAMKPLTKIATDERYYKKILPVMANIVGTKTAFQSSAWTAEGVFKTLKSASPPVQALARTLLLDAYLAIPDVVVEPGGQITPNQTEVLRDRAYTYLRMIPGSDELIMKMPKLTSKWQASRKASDKFNHDGRFVPNTALIGSWTVVDQTGAIEGYKFDPKKQPGKWPYKAITFKDKGATDNANRQWTGSTLIDLGAGEARQMTLKRIGDQTYLFIELGGFSSEKPADWKTPLLVLTKKK